MPSEPRLQAYQQFLQHHGLKKTRLCPLPGDASARRYFRLSGTNKPCLLMDMPPDVLPIQPYLRVAGHLSRLGLRVPAVYAADGANGLALIEDLGDATFTHLLAVGESENDLYRLAIDQLLHLQSQTGATEIDAPLYDEALLLREAARLPDWFYPALTGCKAAAALHAEYLAIWQEILRAMPEPVISLVLVDFHVDNLLRLADDTCGMLDFQDARIGPAAYDVVSLLEDARRDVSPAVVLECKARYLAGRTAAERSVFEQWYAVLGAQRHCKVLGLFLRLCITAGKCQYMAHIPRVVRLLEHHLQTQPCLQDLQVWLDRHLPMRLQDLPEFNRLALQELLGDVD